MTLLSEEGTVALIESVDDAVVCVSFQRHGCIQEAKVDDHEDPSAIRVSLRVPVMSLEMRGFRCSDEVVVEFSL